MQQFTDEHKYKEELIFMNVNALFDKFAWALCMPQTKNSSQLEDEEHKSYNSQENLVYKGQLKKNHIYS